MVPLLSEQSVLAVEVWLYETAAGLSSVFCGFDSFFGVETWLLFHRWDFYDVHYIADSW